MATIPPAILALIPGYFSFKATPGEKPIVPSFDIPSLPKAFQVTIPPIPIPPVPSVPMPPTPAVLASLVKPYIPPPPELPKVPSVPTISVEVKKT